MRVNMFGKFSLLTTSGGAVAKSVSRTLAILLWDDALYQGLNNTRIGEARSTIIDFIYLS
jgi:hypothetical protein